MKYVFIAIVVAMPALVAGEAGGEWLLTLRAPVQAQAPVQAEALVRAEACVPYSAQQAARDTLALGLTPYQLDRFLATLPRLKPGFKWCRGQNGITSEYQVREGYLGYARKVTGVYAAPFTETVIVTLAAGSSIYALEHNGSYAHVNYSYNGEWFSGWVSCGNISVTQSTDARSMDPWDCL
jgi:hypothetical protein